MLCRSCSSLGSTPRPIQCASPHLKTISLPSSSYSDQLEGLLHHQLVGIAKILLRAGSVGTFDHSTRLTHIEASAHQYVDDCLQSTLSGPSSNGLASEQSRLTAYAQLVHAFNTQLEHIVTSTSHVKLVSNLRDMNQSLRNDLGATRTSSSQEIASKELALMQLTNSLQVVESKNATLLRAVELLEQKLCQSKESLAQAQDSQLTLVVQGLDYSAEVHYASNKLLSSVKARLGFVPSTVEKQLTLLKSLKPPGDVEYVHMRAMLSKKKKGIKKGSRSQERAQEQTLDHAPDHEQELEQALDQELEQGLGAMETGAAASALDGRRVSYDSRMSGDEESKSVISCDTL